MTWQMATCSTPLVALPASLQTLVSLQPAQLLSRLSLRAVNEVRMRSYRKGLRQTPSSSRQGALCLIKCAVCCVCVCVCVCVLVREWVCGCARACVRERERAGAHVRVRVPVRVRVRVCVYVHVHVRPPSAACMCARARACLQASERECLSERVCACERRCV